MSALLKQHSWKTQMKNKEYEHQSNSKHNVFPGILLGPIENYLRYELFKSLNLFYEEFSSQITSEYCNQ
jgi:hypothetical protein